MELTDKQRDTLASLIGEGVHTGLRKWCGSRESAVAHKAIRDLPEGEWHQAVWMAVVGIDDYLRSGEFERDGAI